VSGSDHEGERDAAIQELKFAVSLKPNYPDALYSLGRVYYELGQFDAAIAELRKAIALTPDSVELRILIAKALVFKGDHAGAAAEYRRALSIHQHDAAITSLLLFQLAQCLARREYGPEAKLAYTEAYRLNPALDDSDSPERKGLLDDEEYRRVLAEMAHAKQARASLIPALSHAQQMVYVGQDVNAYITAADDDFRSFKEGQPATVAGQRVWASREKPLVARGCTIKERERHIFSCELTNGFKGGVDLEEAKY
jgi:tetratricopeptide (TPR) repeat protein